MESSADHTGGPDDVATVAFIDLAGFSAITDVFGDAPAVRLLEVFESLVQETLGPGNRPVKWIGDETMLAFADPDIALQALGRLLPACRADARLPLTRAALNHGPVVRRENDVCDGQPDRCRARCLQPKLSPRPLQREALPFTRSAR